MVTGLTPTTMRTDRERENEINKIHSPDRGVRGLESYDASEEKREAGKKREKGLLLFGR